MMLAMASSLRGVPSKTQSTRSIAIAAGIAFPIVWLLGVRIRVRLVELALRAARAVDAHLVAVVGGGDQVRLPPDGCPVGRRFALDTQQTRFCHDPSLFRRTTIARAEIRPRRGSDPCRPSERQRVKTNNRAVPSDEERERVA